jgi:hypothetical protein
MTLCSNWVLELFVVGLDGTMYELNARQVMGFDLTGDVDLREVCHLSSISVSLHGLCTKIDVLGKFRYFGWIMIKKRFVSICGFVDRYSTSSCIIKRITR